MRHNKKINHLGRTASHRKAMLANMASSLILHKRINTTVAKAKALRKFVEPLITKSKLDNTHARRVVFSYLQDKEASKVLFNEVSEKVMDRAGGYTRIIKLGNRLGDNSEMAMIELVDYNTLYGKEEESKGGAKRSRRRRGGKKSGGGGTQAKAGEQQEQQTDASVAADTEQGEEKQSSKKTKDQEGKSQEAKSSEAKGKTSGNAKSGEEKSSSAPQESEDTEKKQSAAKSDKKEEGSGKEEKKDTGGDTEGKQSDDDNTKNKE